LKLALFGLLACAALAACASNESALGIATATATSGSFTSDQVTISDVDRGATTVTWKAQTPSGRYSCEADDMVRRPHCVKT
jgi:hypothetical protein